MGDVPSLQIVPLTLTREVLSSPRSSPKTTSPIFNPDSALQNVV